MTRPFKQYWTAPLGHAVGQPMVITDAGEGVGWGVLRRRLGKVDNDLVGFVHQKLTFGRGPAATADDWHPQAIHTVLLPEDAPSDLLDARRLAERYEADAFPGIKDLACVAKIDIHRHDQVLKEWPRIVRFASVEFAEKRQLGCIAILHTPSKSGVRRSSHVHLVAPARELSSDGFGSFVRPFASDAGGPEIARAWRDWPV